MKIDLLKAVVKNQDKTNVNEKNINLSNEPFCVNSVDQRFSTFFSLRHT
jgi:hypothetical protein